MEIQGILVAVGLLVLAVILGLYLPARFTRRAMTDVVERFRRHNALGPDNAKSQAELGLNPPSFIEKIAKRRDYKPEALRVLQQIGAVQHTEDQRLFLVEEKLHESLRGRGNS